jgi:hypothetical protein
MKAEDERVQRTLSTFKSSKVMTMDQLSKELGISSRNTRRRLKKWGALTSYNQNGRFYAHPEVACFDEHGVWSHGGVHFSTHGNLRNTLVALVENSRIGVSAAEAGRALRLNPQSFLSHFRADPRLSRERVGGRFIYFSARANVRERQRRSRLATEEKPSLADSVAVVFLVEKIKRPTADLFNLVNELRKRGLQIDIETAESFLRRHGLQKKT